MIKTQDKVAGLIALPNQDDYFAFTESKQLDLQLALSNLFSDEPGTPPPVMALAAPLRVNLDSQSMVPVLLGNVQSGMRNWQVNFKTNLHVFIREHTNGAMWVLEPLVNMRRPKNPSLSGRGTPPDAINATSWSAGVELFDLHKKLQNPLNAGRITVTAVAHDILSNSVSLLLESAKPPPQAPLPTPQPYVRHTLEKAPVLPTKVELSGTIIKVATQIADIKDTNPPAKQQFWSFHVILIQLDEKPIILPVTTPVQRVVTPDAKIVFNASFELDMQVASDSILSGAYQAYVDIGSAFVGPFPLALSPRKGAEEAP